MSLLKKLDSWAQRNRYYFKKEGIYIFVEVKTRTNLKMGMPESAISYTKIKNVTEASQVFLIDKQYKDIRFDVISIILKKILNPNCFTLKMLLLIIFCFWFKYFLF